MTAKEYLSQVRRCDILINQRIQQKEELQRFDGLFATDYSRDKVSSSHAGEASFVRMIERISEIEAEITRLIDSYVGLKNQIIKQLEQMENQQYIQILHKKYIEYMPLVQIAADMGYSYAWMRHVHGCALQEFGKKFLKLDTQKHI